MYERYCRLRDLRGFNDSQVSEFCDIPKSTFSDWKKGKSIPKVPKIAKIAEMLDCSLDYLVRGKEYKPTFPEQADLWIAIRHDKELLNALEKYMKLSGENKKRIIERIDTLSGK